MNLLLSLFLTVSQVSGSFSRSKYRALVGQNDAAAVSYVSDVRKRDWRSVRDFETHFPWMTPELFTDHIVAVLGILLPTCVGTMLKKYNVRVLCGGQTLWSLTVC